MVFNRLIQYGTMYLIWENIYVCIYIDYTSQKFKKNKNGCFYYETVDILRMEGKRNKHRPYIFIE